LWSSNICQPADAATSGAVRLNVAVDPAPPTNSPRVREVCWQFGITPHAAAIRLAGDVSLPLRPGQITLVTGPSGSGKSITLRYLARQLNRRAIWVDWQHFHPTRPIIDQVAPHASLAEAASTLTACGLGEPRLWLRRITDLSDGEQFRARLARAVSLAQQQPGSVLLVDEFCALLHRRLARAMSYCLRKTITRQALCMVAATTRDDLSADLQPDQTLRLDADEPALVTAQTAPRRPSFWRRLHIESGKLRDYKDFDAMHYRRRAGLGPISRIFVLRDGIAGQALGIVVYGYPSLSLHLRNLVTDGAYKQSGQRLNRDFRILRRLVIHPDVRGCGLAHWLVSQTLPQVGTRYVECLAAMGAVNPVFERAGMIRLGTVRLPRCRQQLHDSLAGLGIDPLSADFGRRVSRQQNLRRLVGQTVHKWLQATTGRPIERIRSLGPDKLAAAFVQLMGAAPIYYLWSTDPAERSRLHCEAGRLALQEP